MAYEMDLEQEMTYDAGTAVKTPETARKRNSGANPLTVDDLNRLEEKLNAELETALAEADAASIVDIREQLSRMPLMRTATEIESTRNRLAELEVELERNKDKTDLIRKALSIRKAEYQAQIDALAPFEAAYQKCVYELGFSENEYQLLLMNRRELRSRLFNLTADLKDGN